MHALRLFAKGARLLRREGLGALGRRLAYEARRRIDRSGRRHPFLLQRPPTGSFLGMTTPEERAFLYHWARHEYDGHGTVVDLGCWLGSSTAPLAAGLAANDRAAVRSAKVHAYDLFLWQEWMEEYVAGTALAGRFRPSESFLPHFEECIGGYRELVVAQAGDLEQTTWPQDQPIAFLFNDASKSWGLAASIWRNFYTALIPGRSVLVEQDFAHYFTPWVHLLHWRFRDAFEPLLHVPYSGSMVFRLVDSTSLPSDDGDLDFAHFGDDEIDAAFDRSMALVEKPMRPNVWAARVMVEVHRGDSERGRRLLEEAPARRLSGLDLDRVRCLLDG